MEKLPTFLLLSIFSITSLAYSPDLTIDFTRYDWRRITNMPQSIDWYGKELNVSILNADILNIYNYTVVKNITIADEVRTPNLWVENISAWNQEIFFRSPVRYYNADSPDNSVRIGTADNYFEHSTYDLGFGIGTSNNIVSKANYTIFGLGEDGKNYGTVVFTGGNSSVDTFAPAMVWHGWNHSGVIDGGKQLSMIMLVEKFFSLTPRIVFDMSGGLETLVWQSSGDYEIRVNDTDDYFLVYSQGGSYFYVKPMAEKVELDSGGNLDVTFTQNTTFRTMRYPYAKVNLNFADMPRLEASSIYSDSNFTINPQNMLVVEGNLTVTETLFAGSGTTIITNDSVNTLRVITPEVQTNEKCVDFTVGTAGTQGKGLGVCSARFMFDAHIPSLKLKGTGIGFLETDSTNGNIWWMRTALNSSGQQSYWFTDNVNMDNGGVSPYVSSGMAFGHLGVIMSGGKLLILPNATKTYYTGIGITVDDRFGTTKTILEANGSDTLFVESTAGAITGFTMYKNTHYGQIYLDTGNVYYILDSDYPIVFTPSSDSDNYIRFSTVSNQPILNFVASNGKITADNGVIDFDNENLTTTGTLSAGGINKVSLFNVSNIFVRGNVTLENTVWDTERVPVTATKLGGINDPDFVKAWDDGAGSQGVFTYAFDASLEEELFFNLQLPHSYKSGTNLRPSIHFFNRDNNAGNIVWGLEYNCIAVNGTFSGTTTLITATIANDGTNKHSYVELPDIVGTNFDASTLCICRVYRAAGDVADTYGSDTYMTAIDFHYQKDKLGTDTEYE